MKVLYFRLPKFSYALFPSGKSWVRKILIERKNVLVGILFCIKNLKILKISFLNFILPHPTFHTYIECHFIHLLKIEETHFVVRFIYLGKVFGNSSKIMTTNDQVVCYGIKASFELYKKRKARRTVEGPNKPISIS